MDMTVEVPELPELTFDEASHIYRLNGDIIPSVSKLMEPLKDQCYGGMRRSHRRSRYSAACGRRAKSRSTSSRNDSLHSKKSWPRFPRNCGIGKDQRRSIYVAAGIQSIILRRSSGSRGQ